MSGGEAGGTADEFSCSVYDEGRRVDVDSVLSRDVASFQKHLLLEIAAGDEVQYLILGLLFERMDREYNQAVSAILLLQFAQKRRFDFEGFTYVGQERQE